MNFDIRLPVGLLFLAIGLLVAGAGLMDGPSVLRAEVNIDLVWGGVMVGFGMAMLLLTRVHRKT